MKGNPRPTRMPKVNTNYLPKGKVYEENPQGRKLAEKLRKKSFNKKKK